MGRRGLLLVLSGPSGAGKGTLRQALLSRCPGLQYAVSATTRPPRPGEKEGEHYFFLSPAEFQRWLEARRFVEWARVYGHLYGSPRQPMESLLERGVDVVVEKDVQGAATLMRFYPEAAFVFVAPPSLAVQEDRIRSRGTDSPASTACRLDAASREWGQAWRFDYLVVNDDLDRAVGEVLAVLRAEKRRVWRLRAAGELASTGGEG
ncbi:MAG: guanylate kinase [Acetobacteraceae bacterium]|nr:guanylate kinase [Acetobacteraceae bacterium]